MATTTSNELRFHATRATIERERLDEVGQLLEMLSNRDELGPSDQPITIVIGGLTQLQAQALTERLEYRGLRATTHDTRQGSIL
jgi:hypothetical protein